MSSSEKAGKAGIRPRSKFGLAAPSEKAGKAGIRPRSKFGLAALCSIFFLTFAGISWASPSGYYGPVKTGRHTHSSNSDGGNVLVPKILRVTGSMTLGVTLTSTATYASPFVNGDWTPIASTHVWSAATQSWFYNIVSTSPTGCGNVYPEYKLHANVLLAGANAQWEIQFSTGPGGNADSTAANYVYNEMSEGSGAGTVGATDNPAGLIGYHPATLAGERLVGDLFFAPKPGNDHRVSGYWAGMSHASSDVSQSHLIGMNVCDWGHTANIGPLYGLKFFPSAGTFTGDLVLYLKCGS